MNFLDVYINRRWRSVAALTTWALTECHNPPLPYMRRKFEGTVAGKSGRPGVPIRDKCRENRWQKKRAHYHWLDAESASKTDTSTGPNLLPSQLPYQIRSTKGVSVSGACQPRTSPHTTTIPKKAAGSEPASQQQRRRPDAVSHGCTG